MHLGSSNINECFKVGKVNKLQHAHLKITCVRKAVHIMSQNIDEVTILFLKVMLTNLFLHALKSHLTDWLQCKSLHFVIKELPYQTTQLQFSLHWWQKSEKNKIECWSQQASDHYSATLLAPSKRFLEPTCPLNSNAQSNFVFIVHLRLHTRQTK